jgi:ketol-acid reductoisomerase
VPSWQRFPFLDSQLSTLNSMPSKIYTDKDADLSVLKGKTCAVLGFGSQGHAHSLNLKESGVKVIIGLYPGSRSIPVAKERGFEVFDTGEAVRRADVIMVALPDTKQAAAFEKDIRPNLTKGKTLIFSHGFSIHFKTVVPPKGVNVIMVAPKGPGHIVRRQYTEGKGVPSLIAVYQGGNAAKRSRSPGRKASAGLGAGRDRDRFQGRDGDGSFRRADRALRRLHALVQAGFEVLGRGGLFAGDGLLRSAFTS